MKKTFLILCISGFGFFASAQSFDVGLKGGVAGTWLMNTNVNNAGTDEDLVSTISGDFGLHLEYNFNDHLGIELEFISESFQQKYKGTFANPPGIINYGGVPFSYVADESYTATTKLSELKIPLLFHYEATSGFCFEVGPELASISNATYTANFTANPIGTPSTLAYSTKGDFGSSNFVAALGIGWNFKVSDKFFILADLRFEYGLTDLVGTDGHGQDLSQSFNNGNLYTSHPYPGTYNYPSYTATHSLEGSLNIGVFYRIPTGGGSSAKSSGDNTKK